MKRFALVALAFLLATPAVAQIQTGGFGRGSQFSGDTVNSALTLYSNDPGASAGPILDIYRDSASPAASDIAGIINFTGNTSTGAKRTYAGIQSRLVGVTNGAENGALDINIISNGTLRNLIRFAATGANPITTMTWGNSAGSSFTQSFNQSTTDGVTFNISATGATTAYEFRNATNVLASLNNLASGHGKFSLIPGLATPAGGLAGSGLTFGSTANFGIFFGSGLPTLAAAQGSLYLRSDGSSSSTRLYVNTDGNTTWVNFTSAS